MNMDDRLTGEQVRAFARQCHHELSPAIREQLEAKIVGDKEPEFYAGLMAGYSHAYSFMLHGQGQGLGAIIASLADFMEKKEFLT